MQWDLWSEVRNGIRPEKALSAEPGTLKADLHRIRDYCSNCALRRLGEVLLDWELQAGGAEGAKHYGPLALETASLSIDAIKARYPHLRPGLVM